MPPLIPPGVPDLIPPANLPSKFPFQITFKIRRFPQQITLKITFSNNLQTFLQISCRKSGVEIPQNEIYNIGTEILYFQCLNCLQTRLFCKSIIPEDSGITRRALSNASVKTRFKAILKIKDAWFCIPSFTFLRFYVLTFLLQNNTTPNIHNENDQNYD